MEEVPRGENKREDYGSDVVDQKFDKDTQICENIVISRYRVAALGFYQRDNGNTSYQERRQTMEELLNKFMVEFAIRHDEHSSLIKEIRALMDAAIRNQRASIKALEIPIRQMSKTAETLKRGVKMPFDRAIQVSNPFSWLFESKWLWWMRKEELNDHKMEDLDPKIEDGEIIDEPKVDIVKIRRFYNLIMKEKIEYKERNVVGVSMNVHIFVGKFSIVIDFKIVENMDAYHDKDMGDVIIGKPSCRVVNVEEKWFQYGVSTTMDTAY
ncbi:hypothetical protein Tco_0237578 [Tanacetum coccineum]